MPVRIRLSRQGAKKRPFYRIVVADSRRSRDGKFIDRIGTYNPMLPKDSPERVKINAEKAKEWIIKGAQPSGRVRLFLSNVGIGEKPEITEKTKKHLPKKKTLERIKAAEEAKKIAADKATLAQSAASDDTSTKNNSDNSVPQQENIDSSSTDSSNAEEQKAEDQSEVSNKKEKESENKDNVDSI